MQSLKSFAHRGLKYIFTDIDGTLTSDGQLSAEAFSSLWQLREKGFLIVPVTGRPAGWCDLIARQWPVHGVIGENGALYFSYQNQVMKRYFFCDKSERRNNRKKLKAIAASVRDLVTGARVSADQFTRLFDLAIDFAEDVERLPATDVQKIKSIFEAAGAHAKVSNIHVNGWFGDYDKLSACEIYCKNELKFSLNENLDLCAFVGDSPNDEPMFKYFKWSFAVANVSEYLPQMTFKPAFVSPSAEGKGFVEISQRIINL